VGDGTREEERIQSLSIFYIQLSEIFREKKRNPAKLTCRELPSLKEKAVTEYLSEEGSGKRGARGLFQRKNTSSGGNRRHNGGEGKEGTRSKFYIENLFGMG